jgi:TRAP transporter TAXI family solute receptor
MLDASNEGSGLGNRPVAAPAQPWSGLARRVALSLALGLLPSRMAVAQAPLVLATSTPGGGLSAFADALLTELSRVKPELLFTHRHTSGSAENIRMLGTGAADMAIVAGETATNALAGVNAPMVLAALYGTPVMFAVRGDSPYRDFASLREQPVLWGASGSNFVVVARQVMGSLGLDIEHDFRPVFVSQMADAPVMVLDGRVAALWGGGAGWPAFAGVAAGPRGIRFITPASEEQRRIVQAHPSLRPMSLPADSYSGQTAAIPSIGTWVYLVGRRSLPEDAAYQIARGLHQVQPALARHVPQAAEMTPASTIAATPDVATIHPGARHYLQEVGVL